MKVIKNAGFVFCLTASLLLETVSRIDAENADDVNAGRPVSIKMPNRLKIHHPAESV